MINAPKAFQNKTNELKIPAAFPRTCFGTKSRTIANKDGWDIAAPRSIVITEGINKNWGTRGTNSAATALNPSPKKIGSVRPRRSEIYPEKMDPPKKMTIPRMNMTPICNIEYPKFCKRRGVNVTHETYFLIIRREKIHKFANHSKEMTEIGGIHVSLPQKCPNHRFDDEPNPR